MLTVVLRYQSAGDLRGHLLEHDSQGAMFLPCAEASDAIEQYAPAQLSVEIEGQPGSCQMHAEIIQVMPGTGLVAQIADPGTVADLIRDTPDPKEQVTPPQVGLTAGEAETAAPTKRKMAPGNAPTKWSIEKLQSEWDNLTVAEKVRVARFGGRPARMHALRQQDKMLQPHILTNPTVTPDEIAQMAGMSSLDPAVLRRILMSHEWLRHKNVVRALICNPKLTLPQIVKILRHLPTAELRRLASSGKVRASVKREIIKAVERGR